MDFNKAFDTSTTKLKDMEVLMVMNQIEYMDVDFILFKLNMESTN